MLTIILVVLLILLLFGAFPSWPHSRSWGYMPFSSILVIGLIVVLLVALL